MISRQCYLSNIEGIYQHKVNIKFLSNNSQLHTPYNSIMRYKQCKEINIVGIHNYLGNILICKYHINQSHGIKNMSVNKFSISHLYLNIFHLNSLCKWLSQYNSCIQTSKRHTILQKYSKFHPHIPDKLFNQSNQYNQTILWNKACICFHLDSIRLCNHYNLYFRRLYMFCKENRSEDSLQ